MMAARDRYTAGWLDCSVQEFLEGFPKRARATKYALVTSLDSNTDLRSYEATNHHLRMG